MSLFSRKPKPTEPSPPSPASLRRPAVHCVSCMRQAPPFVYMENGRDYCIPCAKQIYEQLHIRPAGSRAEDLSLEELLNR